MNKLSALSIATVIALGSFSQIVPAVEAEHAGHGGQPQPMGGAHGGGNMHEMMMQHMMAMHEQAGGEHKGYAEVVLQHTEELKLTDEQIGKITRIHQDNRRKFEEIGKKVRESMKTAHDTFLNPASEEAAIRKTAQEHTAAFNDLVETALQARNAVNAVLTPEQLQKLKSVKGEH